MNASGALVDDLFRRESARLITALARWLGPAHLALAEDAVQDALVAAMDAWRLGPPRDPTAWVLEVARRRAIDRMRREARFSTLPDSALGGVPGPISRFARACGLTETVDVTLSADADAENQLAMMFAICDDALAAETHVTLVLRLLCGLSPAEIARAFLVDVQTIDRRLHRGRARLSELGRLDDALEPRALWARQPSVEHALYLLFSEGYHGSDPNHPLKPAICADALRLTELMLTSAALDARRVHALAALFCFDAARLATRMNEGEFVPLAEQDRTRWDGALIARGAAHLGQSATGEELTRWHLEAGIALEHTMAPSVDGTNWTKIVAYYEALMALGAGPVVAMNRALAIAELHGLDAGREALVELEREGRLAHYSFYWAARADVDRRAGRRQDARARYGRAVQLATSDPERRAYARRLRDLGDA